MICTYVRGLLEQLRYRGSHTEKYQGRSERGSLTLIARAFTRALTMASLYGIMADMYDIYSIDTKIINIDRSHNLEKRTKAPLSITQAISLAVKLEGQGHIIELRKVSSAA